MNCIGALSLCAWKWRYFHK